MQTLTKDARGFVDGVIGYLRHEQKSTSAVPKVQALLHKVTVASQKEKVASVETSIALTSREKTRLGDVLARLIGHPVRLSVKINPELIGGLRIQVGDWVLDTTLHNQLEYMKQSLLKDL